MSLACQHTSSSAGWFGDGGGGAGERREHTQVTDATYIYGMGFQVEDAALCALRQVSLVRVWMSSWSWDGGRWEKCCEGKVAERRRNTQEKPYTSCWLRSDLQGREGRGGEGTELCSHQLRSIGLAFSACKHAFLQTTCANYCLVATTCNLSVNNTNSQHDNIMQVLKKGITLQLCFIKSQCDMRVQSMRIYSYCKHG